MRKGIITCPYCGSTDVIAGPFEMFCRDCGETWYEESIYGAAEYFVMAKTSIHDSTTKSSR